MITANGNLSLTARQVYPTTGTTFSITSAGADATIRIGRSGSGEAPPVPYSAGGNLSIQAAHIVQGGVIRVPFGNLTLGSNTARTTGTGASLVTIAPATQSMVLATAALPAYRPAASPFPTPPPPTPSSGTSL